jgi:predicted nucleic acid-binding protein
VVVTGDPEDDYVLAAVRLGRADYLVTGDHGLLALREYAGAKIVGPREFVTILESRQ